MLRRGISSPPSPWARSGSTTPARELRVDFAPVYWVNDPRMIARSGLSRSMRRRGRFYVQCSRGPCRTLFSSRRTVRLLEGRCTPRGDGFMSSMPRHARRIEIRPTWTPARSSPVQEHRDKTSPSSACRASSQDPPTAFTRTHTRSPIPGSRELTAAARRWPSLMADVDGPEGRVSSSPRARDGHPRGLRTFEHAADVFDRPAGAPVLDDEPHHHAKVTGA